MTNIEYPENREWKQKAFGMPKLPSGDMGQDKVLYYILKMVKDGKSANTMFNIEGSNSTATLGRMCEWIRPIGLVNKEKQVWTLTELGEMVLVFYGCFLFNNCIYGRNIILSSKTKKLTGTSENRGRVSFELENKF